MPTKRGPNTVRSLPIALTLAIAVAAPPSASAATGWKLSTLSANSNGLQITTRAERCGEGKFGTWTFRQHIETDGKYANVRMKVKITKDGALHRAKGIRVTGTAPESAKATMRQTLRSQRTRYVAGSPARLEAVGADGGQVSARAFKPKRTKRC
jgi:hypothetical protein